MALEGQEREVTQTEPETLGGDGVWGWGREGSAFSFGKAESETWELGRRCPAGNCVWMGLREE